MHHSTPIIFLHIPKAGGSTLRGLLHKQYPAEQVYKIESDINGDILRFGQLPEEQRNQIQLLTGHMAFGLHTYLKGAKYITLLRDPIKRVVSEYRFIASNPHHVLNPAVRGMSLLDYLDSDLSGQISNGQTRLISGIWEDHQCGVPGARPVEESDFIRAMDNLDQHFVHPGVLDNYDQTLLLWQQSFGWKWPFYVRENITPGKAQALSDKERDTIADLNQWDCKLYQRVKEEQEDALKRQPRLFHQKVSLFKTLNRAYPRGLALRQRIAGLAS